MVYTAALAVIFCCFGMYLAAVLMSLGMGVFGVIAGAITSAINRSFDSFWITPARCILIGVCVVPLLSVPPAQLIRSLDQLHFPRLITLGMLTTVRFIPILFSEIWQIRDAMRSRGVETAWYHPKTYRLKTLYRSFIVPLIMRSVNISDTLALSVETRGFDPDEKQVSIYKPVRFTAKDAVFTVLCCVVTAALIIVKIILK